MRVVVRLPSVLRVHGGGASAVAVDVDDGDATVGAVLDALAELHPGVGRRVRDERGVLRPHVNLFTGRGDDFDPAGLATAVRPGAKLIVLPAVSGGAVPLQ